MGENISLGKNFKFGSVNLDNLNAGIKKSDLKNASQIKLFEKLDKDSNGVLTQNELQQLLDSLSGYADDGKITKHEAKKFLKENGLKGEVLKKDVFEFLTQLGIASDKINKTTNCSWDNGVKTINVEYKPDDEGAVKTDMINLADGKLFGQKTVKDGTSLTSFFDEQGNVSSSIRESGTVKEYMDDNGNVTKKEINKGSGMIVTVEYNYDESGNIISTTTSNPDGTTVTEDENTITTINSDGSKTVEDKQTGEIQKFDANGELIEDTPVEQGSLEEEVSVQDILNEKLAQGKVKAQIGGGVTGLTSGSYEGTIRIPKGSQVQEGKFPETIMMSLPSKGYGEGAQMRLKLIDAENGIYESSAHDRHFQVTVDESGNVSVNSVDVEELQDKLNANLETYKKLQEAKKQEEQRRLEEQQKAEHETQVRDSSIDTQEGILQDAKTAFEAQLASDGWAGKAADAVSALWGSDNRAVKVRADLEQYENQLKELAEAKSQGVEQFEAKFEEIFGVEYNMENIEAYIENPTNENYQKAYGTKNNIAKRVAVYNESQQKGAKTVKGAAVAAATIAAAAATGGASLAATAAVAAGTTAAARATAEITDLATNDVEGDVGENIGDIAKQAAVEGAIAGVTAGVIKGAGSLFSKTSQAAAETSEALVVRSGQEATEAIVVRSGQAEAGAIAKSAAGTASKGGAKAAANNAANTSAKAAGNTGAAESASNNAASTGAKAAGSAGAAELNSTKAFLDDILSKAEHGLNSLTKEETSKLAKMFDIAPEKLGNLTKTEYRQIALKIHPDRLEKATEAEQEIGMKLFQILNKIYNG